MGNRVLRYAADRKFKFDNIFMVAAEVRFDVFHEEYINSDNERENDGLRIYGILSRNIRVECKGKVYCLFNGADYALSASGLDPSKWVSRLGAVGAHYYHRWGFWNMDKQKTHPEIRDCVENKMLQLTFELEQ